MRLTRPPHAWGPYHIGAAPDLITSHELLEQAPTATLLAWQAATVRRLIVASSGPVVVGDDLSPEHLVRFERAGWPIVPATSSLTAVAARHWHTLPTLRRLNIGYGCPLPSLVLATDRTHYADQPPLSNQTGARVFRALHALGYDELATYVLAVRHCRGARRTEELAKIKALWAGHSPLTYLALGETAHLALKRANIPHLSFDIPTQSGSHLTQPELEDALTAAGLTAGPWHGQTLPTVPVTALAALPYPLCIDTVAINGVTERSQERRMKSTRACSVVTSEQARRLFVTGAVGSIGKAKAAVGYTGNSLYDVARAQGWVAERDEHQRMKTEQYLKADKDSAVLIAKALRTQAMEAAQLAMASVLDRLVAKTLVPSPGQVKQLADVALSLSAANVGETSEAQDALSALSLDKLIEKTQASLAHFKAPATEEETK